MFNFCMLFDSNYLYKGMTLYASLVKHSSPFHLWILCKDDLTYEILKKMNLAYVTLIACKEFEHERLLVLKKERSVPEYAWTLGSSLCWYMLQRIKEGEMITYLDGDMYFFDNPKIIFNEIGNASIAIIEHRLMGERKALEKFVGTYNVAWVSFRKDAEGMKACEWWKERVLEWCGAYFENGKLGDQHYLNDWTTRFNNLCVIKHEGADVAPWNITNRRITIENSKIYIGKVPLVFYHFHNFILINKHRYIPASAYFIPRIARTTIYKEYFAEMKEVIKRVAMVKPEFNYGLKKKYVKSLIASLLFRSKILDICFIKYSRYKIQKTYK